MASTEKGKYLRRRSNGVWYIGVYTEGKTLWTSLKTRNKNEALERLKRPPEIPESNHESPKLSTFRDLVLHNRLKGVIRDSTIHIYDVTIDMFIKILGDRHLHEYTEWDWDKYKNARLSTGLAATTLNIELKTLKTMFKKAVMWDVGLEKNPLQYVKLMKIKKQPKPFLSKEDLAKLVEKTQEDYLKDLYTFACFTGLRLSEITNLKFADCNHSQLNIVNDANFETKNGRARSVPITKTVREILDKRLLLKSDLNDFVFHKKGFQLGNGFVSHRFKQYVRLAKLNEDLYFHCTRHTAASWMLMSGVSISTVKEVLGHSSTSLIDSTYGHLTEKYIKDEVDKIENL